MIRICLLILVVSTYISCTDGPDKKISSTYIDLPAFFKNEQTILSRKSVAIKKIILTQSGREEKIIKSPDFENELTVFKNLDLNKSTRPNMYHVDSLFSSDSVVVIYTSNDPGTEINTITIKSFNDTIRYLSAEVRGKNKFSGIQSAISYETNKGYSIKKTGSSKLGSDFSFEMNVTFIH